MSIFSPSAYPYTLNRFYRHLIEAVKYFPDNGNIAIKTFAWVYDQSDINKPNLGHDWHTADGDYFFSKRYAAKPTTIVEWDYPVLLAAEFNPRAIDPFKQDRQSQKIVNNIKLFVLDKFDESKDVTPESRHRADVIRDCKKVMLKVLEYFTKIEFGQIGHATNPLSYDYANVDLMAQKVLDGDILYFDTGSAYAKCTSAFRNSIGRNNQIQMEIFDRIGEAALAGVSATIELEQRYCDATPFDFSPTENPFQYGQTTA